MQITLWCLGLYLAIGIGITIYFYEPEQDGWLWQILLWPLTLAAIFVS